jgi:hypothetical protein
MDTYSHVLPGLDERTAATVARLILEGHESEPSESIDKPLTTGRVVPSTLDSAEGGEARNARSDAQRRQTGKHANHGAPGPSLWVTTRAWVASIDSSTAARAKPALNS